jgi:hypothetical protein
VVFAVGNTQNFDRLVQVPLGRDKVLSFFLIFFKKIHLTVLLQVSLSRSKVLMCVCVCVCVCVSVCVCVCAVLTQNGTVSHTSDLGRARQQGGARTRGSSRGTAHGKACVCICVHLCTFNVYTSRTWRASKSVLA